MVGNHNSLCRCIHCTAALYRRTVDTARDARSIPPQAETELPPSHEVHIGDIRFEDIPFRPRTGTSNQIAKAIVNHATKPLVSAERRREIQLFVDTIKLVENAFHCKLRGDTDLSGDILIFDQANPLPSGYEFSAYIEPNGHLEFTEWVLDDEVGIEGTKQ